MIYPVDLERQHACHFSRKLNRKKSAAGLTTSEKHELVKSDKKEKSVKEEPKAGEKLIQEEKSKTGGVRKPVILTFISRFIILLYVNNLVAG